MKLKSLKSHDWIGFSSGLQDSEVNYFHAFIDGVDFVFIEAPPFRHRHNDIYGGERSVGLYFPIASLALQNQTEFLLKFM